jgi:glutaredoxin
VKAWLSHAGVAFTARNVDEDDTAYDDLVATGFRTVPLTVVDGRAVVGFVPEVLTEALTARGLWPGDPGMP